jgi:hypothetical protein
MRFIVVRVTNARSSPSENGRMGRGRKAYRMASSEPYPKSNWFSIGMRGMKANVFWIR